MKTFDCIEMQREIRDKISKESNYDIHTLVLNLKERNKSNEFYKFLIEKKSKELELA
ncbi:MAG: hypothetical protein NTW25_11570 [Candidatus Kapabacteria bacterium]|nr:hypothetical protein [Candidatus Kapabacteria bacterium]